MSPEPISFSLGQVFTFMFVTLGPIKVIAPFAGMTRGRDGAFARQLALRGAFISAVALLVAATIGVRILSKWGVGPAALLLTVGVVLFMVALRPVIAQYDPPSVSEAPSRAADAEPPSVRSLAFSPLAFPTIVTPYGIAVVILVLKLRGPDAAMLPILGLLGLILALDFVAMLGARAILRLPVLPSLLQIVGAVMGVLQVALGVLAMLGGIRLFLGTIGPATG
jgi:multiple antibiotic resistance protein